MFTLNRNYGSENFRNCSCPNQHQLSPGEICDICQGFISEEPMPESTHLQHNESYSCDFFNELEQYLDTNIHAA